MQMRDFGQTGLKVSAIGFGCGRVGGLLINGSERDRSRAFNSALAGGINWFDTAEAYGSEEALGNLLKASEADVHVSTKVTLDPRSVNLAADIERQAEACMKRLQRERLTVVQVHNRIDDAGGDAGLTHAQMTGDVLEGLSRLQRKGKTQFIGLTALGDTDTILRVIGSGAFQSAQIYYNIVNPSAARAMPPGWTGQDFCRLMNSAQSQGMGILGIRILDGGIIASNARDKPVSMMARETSEDIEQRKTDGLVRLLAETHPAIVSNRAQFGIRFALTCPAISTALVGIGAPHHVSEALAAEVSGALPQDVLDAIESLYPRDFA